MDKCVLKYRSFFNIKDYTNNPLDPSEFLENGGEFSKASAQKIMFYSNKRVLSLSLSLSLSVSLCLSLSLYIYTYLFIYLYP